jgi:hypothetical protein
MFDSTRKVRAIARLPVQQPAIIIGLEGQRLCSGVWQAGECVRQQAVVFFLHYRVALAYALLQSGAIQYLDVATTVWFCFGLCGDGMMVMHFRCGRALDLIQTLHRDRGHWHCR